MQDAHKRASALPHGFQSIPLSALIVDPGLLAGFLSRTVHDPAFEQEIAENGVQNPIVVDRAGDASFRLLDGARRRAAAVLAGHTHIPAMVYEPLSTGDALLVQYASQNGEATLWTAAEYPWVLRAVLNAKLVAKKGGRYSSEYKWRILGLASDCTKWGDLSKLLKTEGITHSHLAAWRRQFDETGSFEDRRVVRSPVRERTSVDTADAESDAELDAVLKKHGAMLRSHELRALFAGALCGEDLAFSPSRLMGDVCGDDPEFGGGVDETNEAMGTIVNAWNQLTRTAHNGVHLSRVHAPDSPTRGELASVAARRVNEVSWFLRGVDSAGGVRGLGDRAESLLRRLNWEADLARTKLDEIVSARNHAEGILAMEKGNLARMSGRIEELMTELVGLSRGVRAELLCALRDSRA